MFSGPEVRNRSKPFAAICSRRRATRRAYSSFGKTVSAPCGTIMATFDISAFLPGREHATSARFSKFVIQRGTLGHELRKPKGTSNSMILVPLFDLKFLSRTRDTRCRNFKSAALGTGSARHSPILFPGRQD